MRMTTSVLRMGLVAALTFAGTQMATAQGVKQETKEAVAKTGNAITDGWITMKIHAQFVPEKALENSDINVDTKNGAVTLTGTVVSAGAKARAGEIAKATDGVKDVTNSLTVAAAPPGNALTDGWIKSKIYGQFATDKALDGSDINVDITKGAVTLKGHVPSQSAKTHAVAVAKATDGVKSVNDTLTISPARKS